MKKKTLEELGLARDKNGIYITSEEGHVAVINHVFEDDTFNITAFGWALANKRTTADMAHSAIIDLIYNEEIEKALGAAWLVNENANAEEIKAKLQKSTECINELDAEEIDELIEFLEAIDQISSDEGDDPDRIDDNADDGITPEE